MEPWIFLILLGINHATAVTHSLRYLCTETSGVTDFPEFSMVGLVDDVQISHCDSDSRRAEFKQDWMNKVTAGDPQYWEGETETCVHLQPSFRDNIETAKLHFNQPGAVHVVQRICGCEWDNETGEVKGFLRHGYNGKDIVAFDQKTMTWITSQSQASVAKHKWDGDEALITKTKQFLTQDCPDRLKKYVSDGRSSLLRTDRPSVSLLQKSPSSPVSCHATGFYPARAVMFWRKDGEELHEDMDHGKILPNHDGTFQMSIDLKPSSPADWTRYECVFQLDGVKDDIVTKLDVAAIRSNKKPKDLTIPTTAAVFVFALILVASALELKFSE